MKKIFAIVFFIVFLLSGPLFAGLVGEGWEASTGEQVDREIEKRYKTSEDARVTAIGERLVSVCDRQKVKYRFKVINSKEVNAMSVGGGFVYVNQGLLDMVKKDDDMLAFVIAHEIAHITQRHMARSMEREIVSGTLIGILLQTIHASEGTVNTTSVAWNIMGNGYSRTYEFEADRFGMLYALRAGYDPRGSLRLFKVLGKEEVNPGIFVILATHPPSPKRIENLNAIYAPDFKAAENLSQLELLERPLP